MSQAIVPSRESVMNYYATHTSQTNSFPIEVLRKIVSFLNTSQDIVHFGLANCDLTLRLLPDIPLWKSFLCKHFPDSCAKLNADSESLALCKQLTNIVHNMKAGRCRTQAFKGHENRVASIVICGNNLISTSDDNTIKIWDRNNGKELGALVGHQFTINCIAVWGNLLISGSNDNTLKIWDLNTQEEIRTLVGHQDRVTCHAVDGSHIISGSWDKMIKIWDLNTGKELGTLVGHDSIVSCITVFGNTLISGSCDGTVKIWDLNTGKELKTLFMDLAHRYPPPSISCIIIDNGKIIFGLSNGMIHTLDFNPVNSNINH